MPWPTSLARVALVLDANKIHHGRFTLNSLLGRMSLGEDAGKLPDHDPRRQLVNPDEIEIEETTEVLRQDRVIDVGRGPGDSQNARFAAVEVLAVLVPVPADTEAAAADDDAIPRVGLVEEVLSPKASAESDLGCGSEVLLPGWVDVNGVHLSAVVDAPQHLVVGQVGRRTLDPDACVEMIRQVGHLVRSGTHGAKVVSVGVAGGVPMGMIEETRWPEWLHALSLDLSHLPDYRDWIEGVDRPSCERSHLRGTRFNEGHLKRGHWKGARVIEGHLIGGTRLRRRWARAHFIEGQLIGTHLRCRWARGVSLAELRYAARGDGR